MKNGTNVILGILLAHATAVVFAQSGVELILVVPPRVEYQNPESGDMYYPVKFRILNHDPIDHRIAMRFTSSGVRLHPDSLMDLGILRAFDTLDRWTKPVVFVSLKHLFQSGTTNVTCDYWVDTARSYQLRTTLYEGRMLSLVSGLYENNIIVDSARGDFHNPYRYFAELENLSGWQVPETRITLDADPRNILLHDSVRTLPFIPRRTKSDTLLFPVSVFPSVTQTNAGLNVSVTTTGYLPWVKKGAILLPAVGYADARLMNLATSMQKTNDTLRFDPFINDYLDDFSSRSTTDKYNVFLLKAVVKNIGTGAAYRVESRLTCSEDVMVDENDSAVKSAEKLFPDSSVDFAWRIRPYRERATRNSVFSIRTTARNMDNAPVVWKEVVIEGIGGLTHARPLPEWATDLAPPFPHPVVERSTIQIQVAGNGHFEVRLVDALGRPVRTLVQGIGPRRTLFLDLDVTGLPKGMYILMLTTRDGAWRRLVSVH